MKRGKPFEPGNSAGQGRPLGSRNQASLDREALLDEYGTAITKKCLTEAMKGDKSALRLCMERLVPPARQQSAAFKLPAIRSAADLPRASNAILKTSAEGTLSVQDGEGFLRMLELRQRLLGAPELTLRIEALERRGATGTAVELVEEAEGSPGEHSSLPAAEPNHEE